MGQGWNGSLRLQIRNRLPQKLRLIIQMVEVRANFDVVAAMPLPRREVEICKALHSARQRALVQVIVAARALRRLNVGTGSPAE